MTWIVLSEGKTKKKPSHKRDGSNLQHLKQIKTISDEFKYDDENVAVFRLVKRNSFLGFEHIGFDDESEHLCDFSEW